MELCDKCGVNLAMVGRAHRCISKLAGCDKAGSSSALDTKGFKRSRDHGVMAVGVKAETPTNSGSVPAATKRGRPRIGEKRETPWIDAKMSKSTWYRRQKEKQ